MGRVCICPAGEIKKSALSKFHFLLENERVIRRSCYIACIVCEIVDTSVMARHVRSPLRSNRALVATVVPIFTASIYT